MKSPSLSSGLIAIVAALLLALCACGAPTDPQDTGTEELEEVNPPELVGKTDHASSAVVLQGTVGCNKPVQAAFDSSKYHGYAFAGSAGDPVTLSLSGDPAQYTHTVLMLYGPRTESGWGAKPLARNDAGDDAVSRLQGLTLPSSGEYLIIATCRNRYFTGKTYELSRECAADPEPQTSLGIEVDTIGNQRFEPGVVDHLKEYFASLGLALTVQEDETLEPLEAVETGAKSPLMKQLYTEHFQHRGKPGWHYMLMADTLQYGLGGWGLLGGDIFVISDLTINSYPEHRLEAQLFIILHELGHNLALTHEGFEPETSEGSHNDQTCASAPFPGKPIPATHYSPGCIAHIQVQGTPLIP